MASTVILYGTNKEIEREIELKGGLPREGDVFIDMGMKFHITNIRGRYEPKDDGVYQGRTVLVGHYGEEINV